MDIGIVEAGSPDVDHAVRHAPAPYPIDPRPLEPRDCATARPITTPTVRFGGPVLPAPNTQRLLAQANHESAALRVKHFRENEDPADRRTEALSTLPAGRYHSVMSRRLGLLVDC
jgi:hypothetical protein